MPCSVPCQYLCLLSCLCEATKTKLEFSFFFFSLFIFFYFFYKCLDKVNEYYLEIGNTLEMKKKKVIVFPALGTE